MLALLRPRPTTADETDRRAWAIEQMMRAHPELARADVEALYERVTGRAAAPTRRPVPHPKARRLDIGLLLAQAGIALALVGIAQLALAPRATRLATAPITAASETDGSAVPIAGPAPDGAPAP